MITMTFTREEAELLLAALHRGIYASDPESGYPDSCRILYEKVEKKIDGDRK